MREPQCVVAAVLPDGWRVPALAEHRRACLRCQASAVRERNVRRGLEALGADLVPAPMGLQARVLERLGEQDAADPRRALVARAAARYAAVAGLASTALVALVAGLARRHSRALG